ncbi:SNF2 family N-terminal domain-containing protein [Emericellopsis atlantica]|uniref:SNF2 family N-terminal domain-containing protein n=1 Tax=Emericellopsis atlantica TaxID=2614577 RepID=A0A9P8CPZ4_9HYPO|nr:SNF2 family N-terminal domain-containing protein [Emericellopsis atlantica]KAG9255088.1 SNF2 family N-terminal domain-containing protein [Emericellopsis atlantica]
MSSPGKRPNNGLYPEARMLNKKPKLSASGPNFSADCGTRVFTQPSIPIIDLTGDDDDEPQLAQQAEKANVNPEFLSAKSTAAQRTSPMLVDFTDDSTDAESSQTPSSQGLTEEYAKLQLAETEDEAQSKRAINPYVQKSGPACFGLLLIEATSTGAVDLPPECTPATLSYEGALVRVHIDGMSTRAAIFIDETLPAVIRNYSVTLNATICGKKSNPIAGRGAGSKTRTRGPRICHIRVTVYGILEEKDEVGTALMSGKLFLQHPCPSEFDATIKYFNPQYFLLPGEEMPSIESVNTVPCCEVTGTREPLGEAERSQVLRIFDSTYTADADLDQLRGRLTPSPRLRTDLKKHQLEALAMMIEKETGAYTTARFPTLWERVATPGGLIRYQHVVTKKYEIEPPPYVGGGVLADEMGLGKTLSSLSLICHSLDLITNTTANTQHEPRGTLVVTPMSTIYEWERQIETHIKAKHYLYHGTRRQDLANSIDDYDIVLTTYETLRSKWNGEGPLFKQKWLRLILDEAHKIRNRASQLFTVLCEVSAKHRWCLTGTPIQNSLDDYGALLSFIRVPQLSTKHDFERLIMRPVKSKKPHSLPMLRKLVAATCLRRTKAKHASTLGLPSKEVLVEPVEMNAEERKVYDFFKRHMYLLAIPSKKASNSKKGRQVKASRSSANVLLLIGLLRLICNHGEDLLTKNAQKAWKSQNTSFITWETLESALKRCSSCGCGIDDQEPGEQMAGELACGHLICYRCFPEAQTSEDTVSCPRCQRSSDRDTGISAAETEVGFSSTQRRRPSAKVQALLKNLAKDRSDAESKAEKAPPKSVIFSYWTKMLDLIEIALNDHELKFCRIDGQSSLPQRRKAIEKFNSDSTHNIMLASIGGAGEGIDLIATNTVHIVEPHWNPMAEAQAKDRVHRIGQQQAVTVYKYIVEDSIKVYVKGVQKDKLQLVQESLSSLESTTQELEDTQWKKLLEFLQ